MKPPVYWEVYNSAGVLIYSTHWADNAKDACFSAQMAGCVDVSYARRVKDRRKDKNRELCMTSDPRQHFFTGFILGVLLCVLAQCVWRLL